MVKSRQCDVCSGLALLIIYHSTVDTSNHLISINAVALRGATGAPRAPTLFALRGGVGCPPEVGAPNYDGEIDPWVIMYPQLSKTVKKPSLPRIEIPGTHNDIKSAIETVELDHDIFVGEGDHRWEDYLTIPFHSDQDIELNVYGVKGSRLLGRWIIPASDIAPFYCSGSFNDIVCAYATSVYLTDDYKPNSVFSILGGPWSFRACEVRAASAEAIIALDQANVSLVNCQVGGMGLPWTLNGTMSAANGLVADGDSWTSMNCCTVEFCGSWGGSALRIVGEASSSIHNCTIRSSMYGLGINDGCKVKVSLCLFRDNHFAHLIALDNASYSYLQLVKSKVHEGRGYKQGCIWADEDRPGRFDERDNKFVQGWSARERDDWFTEHEDIPEDEWETHPELVRLDQIEDYMRDMQEQGVRRDKDVDD
jgi:hypothetical protein